MARVNSWIFAVLQKRRCTRRGRGRGRRIECLLRIKHDFSIYWISATFELIVSSVSTFIRPIFFTIMVLMIRRRIREFSLTILMSM